VPAFHPCALRPFGVHDLLALLASRLEVQAILVQRPEQLAALAVVEEFLQLRVGVPAGLRSGRLRHERLETHP